MAHKHRLTNRSGLTWRVSQGPEGFGLGQFKVNEVPVETPHQATIGLRNIESGKTKWLPATTWEKFDELTGKLTGTAQIELVNLTYQITISLEEDLPAAIFTCKWMMDGQLPDWEICLAYHQQFASTWACHLYPFVMDSKFAALSPLTYVGVPAALLHREDGHLAVLFGFPLDFDYLNPTTWTGETGFFFSDQITPPQFRIPSAGLTPNQSYSLPLQLVFSTRPLHPEGISELIKNWNSSNQFQVEDLDVRSPHRALELFLQGRRNTTMWNPGIGYQLEEGDPDSYFVYLGEQPLSAYFEYLIYEKTGEKIWRARCFEQMDFMLPAQQMNPAHHAYGAFHTAYDLGKLDYDSNDRGNNIGYKPDLNAYIARYMLQTWQRVKENERLDRQDWYQAAVRAADWVLRQRNPDGGLPQVVEIESGRKSMSVVSGRALPALPIIASLTGDDRYLPFAKQLERYLRSNVEARLHFTGHHPDLPPDEIEEASIWGAIEYWLDKYERTQDPDCLDLAKADALLSLLWWCPKQLSWVENPTQFASAEQQHFLQYSIYCYQNRKLQCLHRLFNLTGEKLFEQIFNRVLQGVFWTQITSGDLMGATHERIADPWLARADYEEASFNSMGTVYMGEQSLDTMLQLVEMQIAQP
jgi:hypothetical protein